VLGEVFGVDLVVLFAAVALVVSPMIWAVADIASRPRWLLSRSAKAWWFTGFVLGTVFLVAGGLVLAVIYLGGVRRTLNRREWEASED
jgi:hypothetical protein